MNGRVLLLQNELDAEIKAIRIRKNIKASLIENELQYVKNIDDNFDIAHFLYPYDFNDFNRVINEEKKCVVSLFYSENDNKSSILKYNFNKNEIGKIPSNLLKSLQNVDKILVPNKFYKKLLESYSINSNQIEIVTAGINNKIYKYIPETDMIASRRYYSINEETNLVIAIGSFKDKECLERIKKYASLRPDILFIFIGNDKPKMNFVQKLFKKKNLDLSGNVIYSSLVDITIYRSLLKNARVMLLLNSYLVDDVQLLEAFAAETQVVALDSSVSEEIIENDVILHAKNVDDVYKLCSKYLDYKISGTISKENSYSNDRDVKILGENLIQIYENVLKEEEK